MVISNEEVEGYLSMLYGNRANDDFISDAFAGQDNNDLEAYKRLAKQREKNARENNKNNDADFYEKLVDLIEEAQNPPLRNPTPSPVRPPPIPARRRPSATRRRGHSGSPVQRSSSPSGSPVRFSRRSRSPVRRHRSPVGRHRSPVGRHRSRRSGSPARSQRGGKSKKKTIKRRKA